MKEKERMLDKNNMTLELEKIAKQSTGKHKISKYQLSKKKSLQEKGITLIALVVTIIILLILAGVTLNIALSDNGLFSKTKEAADKYKYAQSDEEDLVSQIATQMYSEYVGAEVTGYTPTGSSTCNLEATTTGTDATQEFTRDTDMTWKIWDFDGNTLRLIGEPTNQQLTLKGPKGYNNGLWAMDYICRELYSDEEHGVTATTLKRSDILKVSTYDYTKFKHKINDWKEDTSNDIVNTIQFGEEKHVNGTINYPDLWEKNDQGWIYEYNDNGNITKGDEKCSIWESIGTNDGKNTATNSKEGKDLKIKDSFIEHDYQKNEFINEKYFDLIFGKINEDNGRVFIGTRYCRINEDKCFWGMGELGFRRINGREILDFGEFFL